MVIVVMNFHGLHIDYCPYLGRQNITIIIIHIMLETTRVSSIIGTPCVAQIKIILDLDAT